MIYGASGNALKLTRQQGGGTQVHAYHLSSPNASGSNWMLAMDNVIANGTCTLTCQVRRETSDATLTINPDSSEWEPELYVGSNGLIYYLQDSNWVSSGLSSSVDTWEKYTMDVNLEDCTYSAYKNNTNTICTDISYSLHNGNTFRMPTFTPAGATGTVVYLDDVLLTWVPKLSFTPAADNTFLSDDFESHPTRGLIDDRSPYTGYAWNVSAGDLNDIYIENRLSFGNGYKCVAVERGASSTWLASGDSNELQLDPNYFVTIDFDLFVPTDAEVAVYVTDSTVGDPAAAIYAISDGRLSYWNGSGWTATSYTIDFDTWFHVQMMLDCNDETYTIAVQPVGELQQVLGTYDWDTTTTSSDSVFFFIAAQEGTTYFDNVVITYGTVD
ncbi:MAG: hypothetical protein JXB29_09240 [Sedimentisphaerales bacterium]|nr:hypothetical protein [Sedimentisphaerales bacterium]